MHRRSFLSRSLAVGGISSILAARQAPAQQARGTNEEIALGVIGCGGRGNEVVPELAKVPGVRIQAICDVDPAHLEAAAEKWKPLTGGQRPQTFADYRELLSSGKVDAVVITTPNHWHAPMAIAACRAGLDVYVEKPVAHNVAEGQLMVQVARETGRIVMAGTQNRADTSIHAAKRWVSDHAAELGALQSVHTYWYNLRKPIGRVRRPTPVPAEIDYNLFQGPRPLVPLQREKLHYDWHWQWETGSGEMGNVGIHVLDQARFFFDLSGFPAQLQSFGGRCIGVDDGQTPSDHLVALDYLEVPFTLEVRGLPQKKGSTDRCSINRATSGTIAKYENGTVHFDRGGSRLFEAGSNRPRETWAGDSGMRIFANFIDCVRSRKREDQFADIEQGQISTAICEFANIAHRIGETGVGLELPETGTELLRRNSEILAAYTNHLTANEVDLELTPLTLSPVLRFDTQTQRCVGDEAGIQANMLAHAVQRAPFGVL